MGMGAAQDPHPVGGLFGMGRCLQCRGLLPVPVPCPAAGGVAPMGPWPGCGCGVTRGGLQVLAGAWVVSGPPAFWGEGWGSGLGLSPCRRSRWICCPPGPAAPSPRRGHRWGGTTCGGAVSQSGRCQPAEGTMLGTGGNNSADGKRGGEGPALPGSPRRSGPPPQAAPAGIRPGRSVDAAAGGQSRPRPVPRRRGSRQHRPAPSRPRSEMVGGPPLGNLGRGRTPLLRGSPFPRGGPRSGGAHRGLGVGTVRGDPSLS